MMAPYDLFCRNRFWLSLETHETECPLPPREGPVRVARTTSAEMAGVEPGPQYIFTEKKMRKTLAVMLPVVLFSLSANAAELDKCSTAHSYADRKVAGSDAYRLVDGKYQYGYVVQDPFGCFHAIAALTADLDRYARIWMNTGVTFGSNGSETKIHPGEGKYSFKASSVRRVYRDELETR